jgi:hypothetical protein
MDFLKKSPKVFCENEKRTFLKMSKMDFGKEECQKKFKKFMDFHFC